MLQLLRRLAARLVAALNFPRNSASPTPPAANEPPSVGAIRAAPVLLALAALSVVVGLLWLLVAHPPLARVGRGEVGLRLNQWSGETSEWAEGMVPVIPGLHQIRILSMRDQLFRPAAMRRAQGAAPLQSVEGLSFGADLAIRYAIDPAQLELFTKREVSDIAAAVIEPLVQATIYGIFARYTIREIFSAKRAEIQQLIFDELRPALAKDGILLRAVQMGQVDLPEDYRRGMEGLLAEELVKEKMRYTLEIKEKRVRESELEAEAEKVRRELAAEASAREQIIAAKAQEESMRHVLPFKQRQVEQRRLEAQAEKEATLKIAEGSAEARRIEAAGEADARVKLADAEAFRLDRLGKVGAEQMEREGILITRHPLLIQKTLADKLSDDVQVIIAPPSATGGFIGEQLLGVSRAQAEQ